MHVTGSHNIVCKTGSHNIVCKKCTCVCSFCVFNVYNMYCANSVSKTYTGL